MADQSDHPGDNGAHETGIEKQLRQDEESEIKQGSKSVDGNY